MKISKPTLYVIVVGGILAVAALAWNFYNNSQENSTPEAMSSPTPSAKAAGSPATKASPTPSAKAAASPAAKASPTPADKAAGSPATKASPTPADKAAASPAAKAAPPQSALAFRDAVNKATAAAELTQTAQTKAEWNTVANDWQQAIDLMKAVPKDNPKYQVAQKKVVEYQNNLSFAKKASQLAK